MVGINHIKLGVISVLIITCLSLDSCSSFDEFRIRTIDVTVMRPVFDTSSGRIISHGDVYLSFEVSNTTDIDYFIPLDSWNLDSLDRYSMELYSDFFW